MSDIEKEEFRQIGIGLINEYRVQGGLKPIDWLVIDTPEVSAFIRSIQLHEKTKKELQGVKQELADFKQKVSDAVEAALVGLEDDGHTKAVAIASLELHQFIIPAPKPDPLVDVMKKLGWYYAPTDADDLRAALDKLGFEIREKNGG